MSMTTPQGLVRPTPRGGFDPGAALAVLAAGCPERLRHVHEVPARPARTAPWPSWVAPSVYAACAGAGVTSLWAHQRQVADLAWEGRHVVVSTGTASGKSLGYLLPVLTSVVDGATAPEKLNRRVEIFITNGE